MKKIVVLPKDAQPFQFVHEDDVADSIYFLLKNRHRGAFNLAGDGTMIFQEMIKMTRGIPISLSCALSSDSLLEKLAVRFRANCRSLHGSGDNPSRSFSLHAMKYFLFFQRHLYVVERRIMP